MSKHQPHHSDHSGAHAVGTSHHTKNAHDPYDGLTTAEGGKGVESGDSSSFKTRDNEGHADKRIPERPTKLDLPAKTHNASKQE
jgi:hypothetical protein